MTQSESAANDLLDAVQRLIEAQVAVAPEIRAPLLQRLLGLFPELSKPVAPETIIVPVDATGPLVWQQIIDVMRRARLTTAEGARRDQLVAHAETQIAAAISAAKTSIGVAA